MGDLLPVINTTWTFQTSFLGQKLTANTHTCAPPNASKSCGTGGPVLGLVDRSWDWWSWDAQSTGAGPTVSRTYNPEDFPHVHLRMLKGWAGPGRGVASSMTDR